MNETRSAGILFIDTETGGLNPSTDALLEIGIAHWLEGRIIRHESWLIQSGRFAVSERALQVNKINLDEHNRSALNRDQARRAFVGTLKVIRPEEKYRLRVGGHNVAFDVAFIKQLVGDDVWRSLVRTNMVDTASILTFLRHADRLPPGADISLAHGCRAAGVDLDPSRAHTALWDVLATAQLYTALREMVRQ